MNTQILRLLVLALSTGLPGIAQAATYTNLPAVPGTPFGITLDTGATDWESPNQYLSSVDTGVINGSYQTTTSLVFNPTPVVTPAQIGVDGSIKFYYFPTTTTTYPTTSQYQSFDITFSSSLNGPVDVPETYLMSGNVQNLIGSNLLHSGNGYFNFNMGMNLQFVEPYVANSGNATLSFKFGAAPGAWTYAFEKTFALSSDAITLNNGHTINLAGINYFEASYSIDGSPGVSFDLPSLSLNVSGGMSSYSQGAGVNSLNPPQLISSTVIPALPLPVPEAEIYALMLAGLGLVGFMARRRKF